MTTEEWKDYLGEQKFAELEAIASNPTLLEALEDVFCIEIREDNVAAPGRPPHLEGNYLMDLVLRGAPIDQLKTYVVALQLVQNAVRCLEKFKRQPTGQSNSENDAV